MDKKKELQKEIKSHLLIFKNELTALTIESKKIILNALQKLNEVSKWTLLSTKSFRNVINQRQLACNFNEGILKNSNVLYMVVSQTLKFDEEIHHNCCNTVFDFEEMVSLADSYQETEYHCIYACERHQYTIREILHGRILFEIRRVFENNESMYVFFWKVK
jgi:hypothetical protein